MFVTATDTGVGKTVLSAALLAAMAATGRSVRAHKPVVTGLEEWAAASPAGGERAGAAWPADHEVLASACGMDPEDVAPLRFAAAAAPHLAAALEGRRVDARSLLDGAARAQRRVGARGVLVVEGVGGLLAPLADDFSVRDLAQALALPLLIAARPGLGTISHTLLTLEGARAADLRVRAVVLTPWPARPTALERSNRETIERLGAVEVAGLELVRRPDPRALARAGETLPWQRWVAAGAAPMRSPRARTRLRSVVRSGAAGSAAARAR